MSAHEGEECERFKKLSLEYNMSEESSGTDEKSMVVHQPTWRSKSLIKFLEELDRRVIENHIHSKKYVPQKKTRVQGTLLSTVPPTGSPTWAVSKDWLRAHPEAEKQK